MLKETELKENNVVFFLKKMEEATSVHYAHDAILRNENATDL